MGRGYAKKLEAPCPTCGVTVQRRTGTRGLIGRCDGCRPDYKRHGHVPAYTFTRPKTPEEREQYIKNRKRYDVERSRSRLERLRQDPDTWDAHRKRRNETARAWRTAHGGAVQRRQHHLRRTRIRTACDLKASEEQAMRTSATTCPLCKVALTSDLGLPNSKHLDHIVPLCIGGTHVLANVRIICARCNITRPNDGSDLDASILVNVELLEPRPRTQPRPARARAMLAAFMREEGCKFREIADVLGYSNAGNAQNAVTKYSPASLTKGRQTWARTRAKAQAPDAA